MPPRKKADKDATSKTTTTSKKRPAQEAADKRPTKKADTKAGKALPGRPKQTTQAVATGRSKVVDNEAPRTRLQVYACGEGTSGELGLGPKNATEVKAPRPNPYLAGVLSVSTGGMHAAALTHDFKILTWGVNDQGTLGRDTTWDGGLKEMNGAEESDSEDDADLNPKESTPAEISTVNCPANTKFVQVVAGDSTTFALTDDGFVYGCGTFRDHNGIFGFTLDPDTTEIIEIQKTPILIPGLKKITQLSVGSDFALALDSDGHVFAWGSGQQNELGHRLIERRRKQGLLPTLVGLPKRVKILSIHAAANHAFAIDANGETWAWGLNNFGQTGVAIHAGEGDAVVGPPQKVKSLSGKNMTYIEGGSHHSIGLTSNGECLVWGRMDGGQLGLKFETLPIDDSTKVVLDSREKPRILLQPTAVPIPQCVHVAAGSDHCLAVTADGRSYSWGFNATYQCGQGNDEDIMEAKLMNGKHIREEKLVWAGAGGQYSLLASKVKDN